MTAPGALNIALSLNFQQGARVRQDIVFRLSIMPKPCPFTHVLEMWMSVSVRLAIAKQYLWIQSIVCE
jgi:hypothetical protein